MNAPGSSILFPTLQYTEKFNRDIFPSVRSLKFVQCIILANFMRGRIGDTGEV